MSRRRKPYQGGPQQPQQPQERGAHVDTGARELIDREEHERLLDAQRDYYEARLAAQREMGDEESADANRRDERRSSHIDTSTAIPVLVIGILYIAMELAQGWLARWKRAC